MSRQLLFDFANEHSGRAFTAVIDFERSSTFGAGCALADSAENINLTVRLSNITQRKLIVVVAIRYTPFIF